MGAKLAWRRVKLYLMRNQKIDLLFIKLQMSFEGKLMVITLVSWSIVILILQIFVIWGANFVILQKEQKIQMLNG